MVLKDPRDVIEMKVKKSRNRSCFKLRQNANLMTESRNQSYTAFQCMFIQMQKNILNNILK